MINVSPIDSRETILIAIVRKTNLIAGCEENVKNAKVISWDEHEFQENDTNQVTFHEMSLKKIIMHY